jgi:hypothetical protein
VLEWDGAVSQARKQLSAASTHQALLYCAVIVMLCLAALCCACVVAVCAAHGVAAHQA